MRYRIAYSSTYKIFFDSRGDVVIGNLFLDAKNNASAVKKAKALLTKLNQEKHPLKTNYQVKYLMRMDEDGRNAEKISLS